MPSNTIKHVAIYLRISQEKKGEDIETLQNHRELLVSYAQENNFTYEEFGEVMSGGKSEIESRVKLQELLNNIENFDGILCVELSRLSRNGLISQTVKQYCIDYDKPIVTPYQTYDLANSDTDRLMFDVGSMISSHEHSVIGKRSKANKKQMAKAGLHVSGNVPFGYIRNSKTKKLEIDEEAAKTIRYIFRLHSQGLGGHKIRDILNEEGYKSATGKHFNIPAVKRILSNPHYKGWTVFNDRKRIKKNGKVTYETIDTITVKNTHTAIVSEEEWDMANRNQKERALRALSHREKPVTKSGITMLKDLIYCGLCGRKMSIRLDNKSATGYTLKRCEHLTYDGQKCGNYGIRVEFIERRVMSQLLEYKDELVDNVKKIKESGSTKIIDDYKAKISNINKRIKDIADQERKLIDLALSGIFTNEELKDKKEELLATKSNLKMQREELTSKLENSSTEEEEVEKIETIIDTIDKIPHLNPEQSNEALKTFIKRVEYKREIPEDIVKLSTRNKTRRLYPYSIHIEMY
jgi:site-specific DNA recombinase